MNETRSWSVASMIREVRQRRMTYLSRPRLAVLATVCGEAHLQTPDALLIEVGVALGGSAAVIASVKSASTPLELYDTFQGIPAPSDTDGDDVHARYRDISEGKAVGIEGDQYYGYIDDLPELVTQKLTEVGVKPDTNSIKLVQGDIRETLAVAGPQIAFAHIDVDWYDPTLHALNCVWNRLAPGGRILIDDFRDWSGCRDATESFVASHPDARLVDTGLGSVVVCRHETPQSDQADQAAPQMPRTVRKRLRAQARATSLLRSRLARGGLRTKAAPARRLAELVNDLGASGALDEVLRDLFRRGYPLPALKLANELRNEAMSHLGHAALADARDRNIEFRRPDHVSPIEVLADCAASGSRAGLVELTSSVSRAASDAARIAPGPQLPPSSVRLGVLGYRSTSFGESSINIGDPIQTLGLLAILARWDTGQMQSQSVGLVEFVAELRDKIEPSTLNAISPSVELVEVNRDVPVAAPSARPIWLPLFGWWMHPIGLADFGLPTRSPIAAIPFAIHFADEAILDQPGVIPYLQAIGPVGCRDWSTVLMCRRRGISSFFSGCTTSTLGLLSKIVKPERSDIIAVDVTPTLLDRADVADQTIARFSTHVDIELPALTLDKALRRAFDRLVEYGAAKKTLTSRLHCHLPSLALGAKSDLILDKQIKDVHDVGGDPRFDGLYPSSRHEITAMGDRLCSLYDAALTEVFDGASEADFRSTWVELTADLVAEADDEIERRIRRLDVPLMAVAQRDQVPSLQPPLATELATLDCVFAFDRTLEVRSQVAMYSAVESTSRPVRIHVLGREIDRATTEAFLGDLGCEFEIHDTHGLDFPGAGLMQHINSQSTMDRLMLPLLLADVDRVLYIDVDTVVLGDIADLASHLGVTAPLAARKMPDSHGPLHEYLRRRTNSLSSPDAATLRSWLLASQIDLSTTAFNAGVMVLNLARFREDQFTDSLPVIGAFEFHDEELLNLYAASSCDRLPDSWNVVARREATVGANLIHYIGPTKAWDDPDSPAAGAWWQVAKRLEDHLGYRQPAPGEH